MRAGLLKLKPWVIRNRSMLTIAFFVAFALVSYFEPTLFVPALVVYFVLSSALSILALLELKK